MNIKLFVETVISPYLSRDKIILYGKLNKILATKQNVSSPQANLKRCYNRKISNCVP